MAIGPLPPVISEIQANSGQPGRTLAQQMAAGSLLEVQAAATTEPATAILPETTLIEKAVAEALGRQGGLAPLYATLAELADTPDLPDAVKAAVTTLLAFRLGDGDVTPERIAQAVRASGLFHEAVAAGKMAMALPPAVRQALGNSSEGKPPVAARPAASAVLSATPPVAEAVSAAPPPPPGINVAAAVSADVPASAAQDYGRPGAAPASTASPGASQAASTGAVASGPASAVSNPAVTASSTASLATPAQAAGLAAQPVTTVASPTSEPVAQVQPIIAGEPSQAPVKPTVGSEAALPPAVGGIREASAPTSTQVLQAASVEAHPAPLATGEATPSTLPSATATTPAAPEGSGGPALSPSSASSGVPPSPSVSSSMPASDMMEAEGPTQPPATSANPSAPSRSFAPWTPGRPLAAAPSVATPDVRTATSPPAPGHPAPPSVAVPGAGEAAAAHPHSDRAPFVPSTVDSLPTASPGPAIRQTTAGPASSPLIPSGPQQPGSVPPAVSSAPSSQPQLGPNAGQAATQPAQQVPPQTRPTASVVNEIPSAVVDRQPSPPSSVPTLAAPAIGVDLKGALEVLRRELITWLGRNADVMASLDGASDVGEARRIDRPQPPRKGGPVRGQPAVPLLGGDETEPASTETLAGRALGEAERSLSRVFLHQAATAESRDAKAAQPAQAFMLEIPIVGPNGTSIAQLRIERDDHAPSEPGMAPRRVFQVDIAFDIVPLGPVAVRVGLMDGRRVAVGVWCESDDGLVRMEAERENIVLGLEQEGMVVAGVDLHRGHPPEGHDETAAAPSHRLDLQL